MNGDIFVLLMEWWSCPYHLFVLLMDRMLDHYPVCWQEQLLELMFSLGRCLFLQVLECIATLQPCGDQGGCHFHWWAGKKSRGLPRQTALCSAVHTDTCKSSICVSTLHTTLEKMVATLGVLQERKSVCVVCVFLLHCFTAVSHYRTWAL